MVYLSFLEYLICFYHKVKVYFLSVLTVAKKENIHFKSLFFVETGKDKTIMKFILLLPTIVHMNFTLYTLNISIKTYLIHHITENGYTSRKNFYIN